MELGGRTKIIGLLIFVALLLFVQTFGTHGFFAGPSEDSVSLLRFAERSKALNSPGEIFTGLYSGSQARIELLCNNANLQQEITKMYEINGAQYSPEDLQELQLRIANLDLKTMQALSCIISTMNYASLLKEKSIARLNPEEIKILEGMNYNDPEDSIGNIVSKIDKNSQALADSILFSSIEKAKDMEFPVQAGKNLCGEPDVIFADPKCMIIMSGRGSNAYTEERTLRIDLGGDDIYLENSKSRKSNSNVIIDLSGNDNYNCESFCQGFGSLKIGMLLDFSGDDEYKCGSFCQGTGWISSGTLVDFSGQDKYECESACQGFGEIGSGTLLDYEGDDGFSCVQYCQGTGLFGFGAIIDFQGQDNYECQGTCQGSGLANKGLVLDHQGADVYSCSVGCQGTGIFGTGAAIDFEGSDRRNCGRFCQGTGIASVGMIIDTAGDDSYTCDSNCQRFNLYDVGVLIDNSGFDAYSCGSSCGKSGISKILEDAYLTILSPASKNLFPLNTL